MVLEIDPEFLRAANKRLEKNIEIVRHSNFCWKEKQVLRRSYAAQIEKNKQKLASFFNGAQ